MPHPSIKERSVYFLKGSCEFREHRVLASEQLSGVERATLLKGTWVIALLLGIPNGITIAQTASGLRGVSEQFDSFASF